MKPINDVSRYSNILDHHKIECTLCPHYCEILPGRLGSCHVRFNNNGLLRLLTFNRVLKINLQKIEQLPLFNFIPDLNVLTLDFFGDNFRCSSYSSFSEKVIDSISSEISKEISEIEILNPSRQYIADPFHLNTTSKKDKRNGIRHKYTAKEIVEEAIVHKANAIAFSGLEPLTNFEFILDVATEAHKESLKVILITNGYINQKPLEELLPFIDAVHQKFFYFKEDDMKTYCQALLDPCLKTALFLKKKKIHLELSLVIRDKESILKEEVELFIDWVKNNLSEKIPIHIFTPNEDSAYLLKAAQNIGTSLKYPFLYASDKNTYCQNCGTKIITRLDFNLIENNLLKGKCLHCKKKVWVVE